MSAISYYLMRSNLSDSMQLNAQNVLNQIVSNVDNKITEAENVSNSFAFDSQLHYYLSLQKEDTDASFILSDYLLPKGDTSLRLTNTGMAAKLYVNNTDIPEYYFRPYTSESSISSYDYRLSAVRQGRFEVSHTVRIADTAYYQALMDSAEHNMWSQIEDDSQTSKISLLTKLVDYTTMQNNGVLRIVISLSELFSHTEDLSDDTFVVVSDTNGNIVYSSSQYEDLNQGDNFMISQPIEKTGLNIALYVNKSPINNATTRSLMIAALIGLLVFGITFVVSVLMKRALYQNLDNLLIGIQNFEKGNYDYRIQAVNNNDEFVHITNTLNNFASSLSHLINDVYEVMVQKQDIEISALQAKVNPHFLYNIFSIIRRSAKAGKVTQIEEVTDKTVQFYRTVLSDNHSHNTVEKEMIIVRAYAEIINVLHKNNLRIEYKINPASLNCKIPNFIIQPFIENSIKHGMIDGKISIVICSYFDNSGDLIIKITDDGIGIKPDKIKTLLAYKKEGYGIYNVNERIILRSRGDLKYGVSISSEYEKGTTVTITLPTEYPEDPDDTVHDLTHSDERVRL